MVFKHLLKAALIFALATPMQGYAQAAPSEPSTDLNGATLNLPVTDENGKVVDELNLTILEITTANQQLVISTAEEALATEVIHIEVPAASDGVGSKETQTLLGRLVGKIKQMRKKDPGVITGLAVAAASSSLGGLGLYYFGGESASASTIIGTTMFGIALFHGVFTNQWQSYLKTGLYLRNFAGLFKSSWKDNELIRTTGNIAAAAAFNIAPTALALYLTDSYTGLAAAAAIGALGAYDYTIDIGAGKLHRRGRISEGLMKNLVRTRMLFGPVLEMFSIAGHVEAQVAMGAIAFGGLAAILRGEALMDDFGKVKRIGMNVTSTFKKCGHLLSGDPPKIYVRVAYEDTM